MKWLFFFLLLRVHMHIVLRLYLDWWIDLSHIPLARSRSFSFVRSQRAPQWRGGQEPNAILEIGTERKEQLQGEPGAAGGWGTGVWGRGDAVMR